MQALHDQGKLNIRRDRMPSHQEFDYKQQWLHAGISEEWAEKIEQLIKSRHFYRLVPSRDTQEFSGWGGRPSLTPENTPLDFRFICQIALDELPPSEARDMLPESGYLFFFMHAKGRDKAIVIHTQDVTEDVNVANHVFIKVREDVVYPEYESDDFDSLDVPQTDGNAYMDWEEAHWEDPRVRPYEGCRLLGGWTEEALEAAGRLGRKQDEYEVLLALHPKENKEISRSALGDIPFLTSRLFFFIRKEDLQQGIFDRVLSRYSK